jgi:adenylate cyclase
VLESLGERLRSRKLVQWTIAYLAAAFALLQLADFLKDAFAWPTVVLRVLTIVVALGFFIALVLAWYHGEKGHQHIATTEIALLTAITVVTVAASWYVAVTTPPEADAVSGAVAPPGDTRFAAMDDPAAAPASIAVLPFLNMTPDEQNDYLTDGITEDIITELGKVQGLRVISRTSVMRYKQSDKGIREIAGELGVGTVLEGSVRVQGNQVRITAQLIDAATDTHLWAETYDRDLKDILAVQSEVARAITDALNTRLLPSALASAAEVPSVDPDAYRLYLKGKSMANSTSDEERALAVSLLDSAIAKDPDLARAWTARVGLQVPVNLESTIMPAPPSPDADPVFDIATKAAALHPEAAAARSSVNLIRAFRSRDLGAAEQAAREAIAANPNSVPDRLRFAQILYARGKPEEALREMQKAAANDPMSSMVHAQIGEYMMAAGQVKDAETHLLKAIELDSMSARAHLALGTFYSDQGRVDAAIRELQKARAIAPSDGAVIGALGYTLGRAGQKEAARQIVRDLEQAGADIRGANTVIAQVYAGLGDTEQAVEWLRKDVTVNGRGWSYMFVSPRVRHQMEQLRQVPELARLMDSLNIRIEVRRTPGDSSRRGATPPGSRSRNDGRR